MVASPRYADVTTSASLTWMVDFDSKYGKEIDSGALQSDGSEVGLARGLKRTPIPLEILQHQTHQMLQAHLP